MPERHTDHRPLTPRECDVLQHAAFGLSNRLIGERLGIAEQTVKNHLANAMRKLSIHDRTQAVVFAIGAGWIGIPVADPNAVEGADVVGHGLASVRVTNWVADGDRPRLPRSRIG